MVSEGLSKQMSFHLKDQRSLLVGRGGAKQGGGWGRQRSGLDGRVPGRGKGVGT